jgi:hypothetical protein
MGLFLWSTPPCVILYLRMTCSYEFLNSMGNFITGIKTHVVSLLAV